jgi:hypothetical protein
MRAKISAKRTARAWAILLIFAGAARCDDQNAPAPLFFPQNSVRGFADFAVAPPHNEIDTSLCTLTKNNPSPNTTCSAFARYAWDGYLELHPMGRTPLRRMFLIVEPKIFGGNNIPQYRYTTAASPILWELTTGAGLELPRHLELRYKYHKAWPLGRFSGAANAASLRLDGPYGRYATVGVRWNFGGWGHPNISANGDSSHRVIDLRGYVDFEVAPSHDEIDLGLCAPAPQAPLTNTTCAAYARYVWGGYLELQPKGPKALRRISLFVEPKVYGGNNVPQQHYTADPSLILYEVDAGIDFELSAHFEFRFTHHDVTPVARYSGPGRSATLLSDGPYGNNSTIGMRWYFGGWGHAKPR